MWLAQHVFNTSIRPWSVAKLERARQHRRQLAVEPEIDDAKPNTAASRKLVWARLGRTERRDDT